MILPRSYDFNRRWLFGGAYAPGSEAPGYDDTGFTQVDLPHTVMPLSWADWDHASWEKLWIYRKHFDLPPAGGRVLVHFDGVMVSADVVLNGTRVAGHQGGYLPWTAELTGHLREADNVLAVIVDARPSPVPPLGGRGGAAAVDFLQPGGIYRDTALRVVPAVFLADVFARPAEVLTPGRTLEVRAAIDAAVVPDGPVHLAAELIDGSRAIAAAQAEVPVTRTGTTTARVTIAGLEDVQLWAPDSPKLYTVRATLTSAPGVTHCVQVRTGFRAAVFRPDGFYLNGERLKIFGLNRHQLFPYLGMAAPARLQRRDAEILRRDLHCNMVRCSHYPQSPHFLDACDELGLMVWQEPPGWQYVGGAAWQDMVLRDVRDMIIRDRSRPSVIVWGTRLNETANRRRLYARTRQLASELDGTRQTTGAMTRHSTTRWAQDVFGYDDYHGRGGRAYLLPALHGVPYLVSEAVGALSGPPTYRWADGGDVLAAQALLHAQVHAAARRDARCAGLLGWAGFDYPSLNGGRRIWRNMKTPGVLDTFRVPKPGAALYRSQVDPDVQPVIVPAFFWDFGERSPRGPGPNTMIATNCDRLELYLDGEHFATGLPATETFGGLAYPPVFVDLAVDGAALPELRIDGYLRGTPVASVRMAADPAGDHLGLSADHGSIQADGTDATRLTFRALDAFGNQRPHAAGCVRLSVHGPGQLIGDNPFDFTGYGPVGGAFIRSATGQTGTVTITARHHSLGQATARVVVTPPDPGREFR